MKRVSACKVWGTEIEQENQALKVLGGIKNIANSNQNLDEYFLSVAGMGNIIATFCDRFGISEDQMWKWEDHYQLSESKNTRLKQRL